MKKTITLLTAIMLIAAMFGGCNRDGTDINDTDSTHSPAPHVPRTERLGFEGGNIGAGGLVCGGDDGYIYYRSESDGWTLYRANPDGTGKTQISERAPSNINVLDGWVYFLDYSDGFAIYRVRTDGTDETKLVGGYCGNLFVAESGMYFDVRDRENTAHVYRADLDGDNAELLFPAASLMYYYDGKIYLGSGQLGVYDIETDEETILAETQIHNVSVDDSGVYYWAVDEGEYRRVNHDGSGETVILRGGNYFNYSGGNLYYMGTAENERGPHYVVDRLNLASGDSVTLLEEANEFFDARGEWNGITYLQFYHQPDTIDPALMVPNEQGEIEIGYSESMGYVHVAGERLYMRAGLRDSLVRSGRLECIARLDGGAEVWD